MVTWKGEVQDGGFRGFVLMTFLKKTFLRTRKERILISGFRVFVLLELYKEFFGRNQESNL